MMETQERQANRFIPPVRVEELESAKQQGALDPGTEHLLEKESEYIREWRKKARSESERCLKNGKPENLIGLALSGGGIRSATFCLGVLQALARHNLLSHFDYLSTVSGGGYIGAALRWLTSSQANAARRDGGTRFGLDRENFPFGADDPAPEAESDVGGRQKAMLRFLREHGFYLSPGAGISIFALFGVVLRGTVLNLLAWMPLSVLVLIPGFWIPDKFLPAIDEPWLKSLLDTVEQGAYEWGPVFLGYEYLLRLGVVISVLLLVGVVAYSVGTWIRRGDQAHLLPAAAWYDLRRNAEMAASKILPVTALLFIVGLIPWVASYVAAVGILAILIGIATHLRPFWRSLTGDEKIPLGIAVPLGAAAFLYGFLTVAFQIAYGVWTSGFFWFFLSLLVIIPVITGLLVNLNYISVHRYYRDRLMETYMPDIGVALANRTGPSPAADSAYLTEVSGGNDPASPYHLINTNAVLVNSETRTYEARGGDNFILSPLYCGSNATGWCPTDTFMDGKMTLPTAVAVSGAAVNPNSGVGGEGVTRNRILSLVFSLLNLRLSYWGHNPDPARRPRNSIPNHFVPGSYAIGAALNVFGFNEKRPYLQLSDGGHFENTAVYELIRRRVKLIVLSDAGADPDFSFSDFQTAVQRIETDFGVRIAFEDDANPNHVLPKEPPNPVYPPGAKFASKGYMVAKIHYPDRSAGDLIYLKATLVEDTSFRVKGYKARNPAFPHQSTADQFFDDVQFEAYRELGFEIANRMIGEAELPERLRRLAV